MRFGKPLDKARSMMKAMAIELRRQRDPKREARRQRLLTIASARCYRFEALRNRGSRAVRMEA